MRRDKEKTHRTSLLSLFGAFASVSGSDAPTPAFGILRHAKEQ